MNSGRTYTISEVTAGIGLALRDAFPEALWVIGEIQGLDRSRHGKHWYFQFCETDGAGKVHRLSATIWNRVRDRLFGPSGKLSGVMDLDEPLDGIKIRALCSLDFYAPYGKISLHVQDIDPAYTLGDLEAKRQALIEKLTEQGVLHRNRETVLTEVPLEIGLITSMGSAAYCDFMKELESSGVGFRIRCCDARMQGEEACATIRAAFAALEKGNPDAIVLVRGGGSRLDLSWFDRGEVVQNIIECPCPVITGIGHEIDITVGEMAAHTGLKTPTAAAAFLVDRAQSFLESVFDLGMGVTRAAARWVEQEEMRLGKLAGDVLSLVNLAVVEAEGGLAQAPRRLVSAVDLIAERENAALVAAAGRLAAGPHVRRFESINLDLTRVALRFVHSLGRFLDKEKQLLDLLSERCRLLDPVRTIERGYALLTDSEGKAIKSVVCLSSKDRFSARLKDGRILAIVDEVKKEETHGHKEKRQLEIW